MITLPKTAAIFADITVTALLSNGNPATLTGVDVALVTPGARPGASTVWVASSYAASIARVLLVGSLATPTSPPSYRLNVPDIGGDLWARVTDNPEVVVELVAHIEMA